MDFRVHCHTQQLIGEAATARPCPRGRIQQALAAWDTCCRSGIHPPQPSRASSARGVAASPCWGHTPDTISPRRKAREDGAGNPDDAGSIGSVKRHMQAERSSWRAWRLCESHHLLCDTPRLPRSLALVLLHKLTNKGLDGGARYAVMAGPSVRSLQDSYGADTFGSVNWSGTFRPCLHDCGLPRFDDDKYNERCHTH